MSKIKQYIEELKARAEKCYQEELDRLSADEARLLMDEVDDIDMSGADEPGDEGNR